MERIKFGNFKKVALEKVKFTKKPQVISFLEMDPYIVEYCYHPNIGKFFPIKEAEDMGVMVSVRYIFPIILYENDARGRILSDKFEIDLLVIPQQYYLDLIRKFEIYGSFDDKSILVICENEMYQHLKFEVLNGSLYYNDANFRKRVDGLYDGLRGSFNLGIRKITPEQFLEAVGGVDALPKRGYDDFDVVKPYGVSDQYELSFDKALTGVGSGVDSGVVKDIKGGGSEKKEEDVVKKDEGGVKKEGGVKGEGGEKGVNVNKGLEGDLSSMSEGEIFNYLKGKYGKKEGLD